MQRCDWCGDDPLYVSYHDKEWGVPLRDEQLMFEFLVLEGAQAGLSWITILRKRDGYRAVFDNFDVHKVAAYSDSELDNKLLDARIVRNRLKVYGARKNALATLKLYEEGTTLLDYFWEYVGGNPIQNEWRSMSEIPASTPLSNKISKDMKKRGFTFVGPTIIYAHMQATGMVNDHIVSCPRHEECAALA
ncbi:DNA-3-methyladenine glycosylase I [Congregibacter brevis]|uniref:DNA-3-methyladenine glycosylase I n=1 Tax=Congregibacter brevis TaxID=3081201 RepID=A0ABZ0IAK2_9GAMM|nr:DNA-3-methyladenine glycosylase I [Congregibacter sp. IMCC45268]